jgi:hypothetical protein
MLIEALWTAVPASKGPPAVVGLFLVSALLAGCAASGGSWLGADDAQRAGVDLGPLPADAPPAAITSGEAVADASSHALGGPDRGVLLGVARGRASESAGSPAKTVWVVAYGPGGQVPMNGPKGGSETISMQIVLVDDQTGAFMRASVRSAP